MERHNCGEWRIGMGRCSWDQRRRKNEWFQQQEILRSCALTCWCLMRCEYFPPIPVWRFVRAQKGRCQHWCHSFKAQWVCHSYLATNKHKEYGNLKPSRPRSLCQNWLKLANGLQSYFLWDWEGTDGLALKEHNCLHLVSVGSQAKNPVLSLSYKLYMHVFYRGRFMAFNI